MVTNMPFWAEKVGVPRTLAVEFPFGHTLGQPHDTAQHMRLEQRLTPQLIQSMAILQNRA